VPVSILFHFVLPIHIFVHKYLWITLQLMQQIQLLSNFFLGKLSYNVCFESSLEIKCTGNWREREKKRKLKENVYSLPEFQRF